MPAPCDFEIQSIKNKLGCTPLNIFPVNIKSKSENNHIRSAVLLPLVELYGETHLLFTLRSASLERHSNQVSFPGGLLERTDNSLLETALRETLEEIGIDNKEIQVIGQLNSQRTTSEGFIYPFIGIISSLANLKRNELEVENIFYIPLIWLCNSSHSR
jgi:coenzyme A diphosphatase NUDT7